MSSKKKMIRGMLVPKHCIYVDCIREVKAEQDGIDDIHKELEVNCFDVARVMWDGKEISIYVDDEGALISGNTGRDVNGYPTPLFGNLLIFGSVDNYGRTLDLPSEFDEEYVYNKISKPMYEIS